MQFKSDWFVGHIPLWSKILERYVGKENINYLEVGVFEGRSAFWILENVLTHKSSKLTLVDLFLSEYSDQFLSNLSEVDQSQVEILKGDSSKILRTLEYDHYDIIYIDGDHVAKSLFIDLAVSWDLLKVNGLLIIDDYQLNRNMPIHLRPQLILDTFLTAFSAEIELLHVGEQVILKRKIRLPIMREPTLYSKYQACGKYFYSWQRDIFVDFVGLTVPLDFGPDEMKLIKSYLSNIVLGQTRPTLTTEIMQDPRFQRIMAILQIDSL
jgi:predicted O-methyltransferase YrrM